MVFVMNCRKNKFWVCLVILVGILFVNWYLFKTADTAADKSTALQVVKPMDAESVTKIDFFTEYRLERDKLRSERAELLRETMKIATTAESRKTAQDDILQIVHEKQRETEMESLIKAKGFADALVFCRDTSINAIVKANDLSKEEVIQVADIISKVTNAKQEKITIRAKP